MRPPFSCLPEAFRLHESPAGRTWDCIRTKGRTEEMREAIQARSCNILKRGKCHCQVTDTWAYPVKTHEACSIRWDRGQFLIKMAEGNSNLVTAQLSSHPRLARNCIEACSFLSSQEPPSMFSVGRGAKTCCPEPRKGLETILPLKATNLDHLKKFIVSYACLVLPWPSLGACWVASEGSATFRS